MAVEIPMIGQGQQAINMLRLNISSSILCRLAAIDFSNSIREATEKDKTFGGDGSDVQFRMNCDMAAGAAVAYTDRLLIALGLVRAS